jgi:hypothetical protein
MTLYEVSGAQPTTWQNYRPRARENPLLDENIPQNIVLNFAFKTVRNPFSKARQFLTVINGDAVPIGRRAKKIQ